MDFQVLVDFHFPSISPSYNHTFRGINLEVFMSFEVLKDFEIIFEILTEFKVLLSILDVLMNS